MKQNHIQTITLIRRFIQGSVDPYEWDDFISIPLRDPELEKLRITCVNLPKDFPPADKQHYCGQAGLEILESLARHLERKNDPTSQS